MEPANFKVLLKQLCTYLESLDYESKNLFQNSESEYYLYVCSDFVAKVSYYLLEIISQKTDLRIVISELSEWIDFYVSVYEYLPFGINLTNILVSDLARIIYINLHTRNNTLYMMNSEYCYKVLTLSDVSKMLNCYLDCESDSQSESQSDCDKKFDKKSTIDSVIKSFHFVKIES